MRRVCLVLLAAGSPLLLASFWLPEPWGPGVGALLVGVLPAALIGLGVWGGSASGVFSGRSSNSLRSNRSGPSSKTPDPPAPVEQDQVEEGPGPIPAGAAREARRATRACPSAASSRGARSSFPRRSAGRWKKALLLLTLALISPFVLAVYLLRGVDGWLWGLPWPTAVLVYGAIFLLVWTGAVYAATFGREGGG